MTSIIQGDREERCYLCHGRPDHVHHMIHGTSGRKLADRHGLTVHLCWRCHERVHRDIEWDRALQRTAQMAFEELHGHEEWMAVFGKNYL